jgi:recombination protein RecA
MSDELKRFLANATVPGGTSATAIRSLDELRARAGPTAHAPWGFAAARGRLVELSARGASATLTAAIELVVEAQLQAEPVAWVMRTRGTFYPPDVADSGVDLAALVVVRVTDATMAARAAERVLKSGAFGLVVLDLGSDGELSMAIQGRLVTLAQTHDAAVVCLTEKADATASIGSLVSLRAEAMRRRDASAGSDPINLSPWTVDVRALKDKRRGPGWTHTARRRGPAGLT